jgi:hypothetical protein
MADVLEHYDIKNLYLMNQNFMSATETWICMLN